MTHNGFSYNFTYDSWGNQTGVKVGSQSLVTYSYGTGTNHNKLNSITYGNGQAITYQYDAKQNITGIKYSGDSAWRFTYTYDRQGNVKTATDNIAGTKATLDGDRMEVRKLSDNSLVYSSVTAEDGSVTETAFGKTYTRKTNDDSYTQTSGQTVKSGTITSPGTATALSEKTDYFGRTLEKSVLAKNGTAVTGGVSTSYEYKSASAAQTSDRVNILRNAIKTGANTSATKDFSYTYDGNGNLKTVQQVNNDGGSTLLYTYHYDAANQLTRVDDKVQDLTVVYAYNEGGNLVSRTNYKYTTGTPLLLKRTWLYSYDSTWKDQLAYYDAKRIQYDTVGNPTSYNGWAFSWEAGRQLASMSKSGTDVAYQYNADGLRTKKTVTQSGASTVYEYLWNESRLVGQKVGNDAVRILYDANDEPVGFTVNDSASYFYVKNLQGDVLAIVDKTGAEKVSYVYDAYGQIVSMTGDATLQKLNPCTYRGYYYDAETGLYYLQSRYYNPEWGRFINADTTGILNLTQGQIHDVNLYIYCNNSPIMNQDPKGYKSFTIRRWMVAMPLDILLMALGLGAIFAPVKTLAKSAGRAFVKTQLKHRIFKFLNVLKSKVISVSSAILKVLKKIPGISKPLKNWTASKIAAMFFGFIGKQVMYRFMDLLLKNIDVCLSLGGFVSGILDIAIDGRLNNSIYRLAW